MSAEEPDYDVDASWERAHEDSKKIVKDFLDRVSENKFPEFSWPPDRCCPAYRHGYIRDCVKDMKLEHLSKTARKFLDQVRKSWGYDIDCIPPSWMSPSLYPINFQDKTDRRCYYDKVMSAANLVVDRINTQAVEMGKTFEFVRVNKAVVGGCWVLYLLTITIKDVEANSEKYVRAAVTKPPCKDPELEECKLIPSLPTT